ncbi:hypothetical protein EVAR_63924_1 [Eumeta japonica]|uniref:Uncharacterized protein n=1 Tax=Eumeta variegata TaxID=151549 RepID=A0A4C1ZI18_EUMVA|nr:hypothetical protein EVAR_63924_1 [Eumeta japonica]
MPTRSAFGIPGGVSRKRRAAAPPSRRRRHPIRGRPAGPAPGQNVGAVLLEQIEEETTEGKRHQAKCSRALAQETKRVKIIFVQLVTVKFHVPTKTGGSSLMLPNSNIIVISRLNKR